MEIGGGVGRGGGGGGGGRGVAEIRVCALWNSDYQRCVRRRGWNNSRSAATRGLWQVLSADTDLSWSCRRA